MKTTRLCTFLIFVVPAVQATCPPSWIQFRDKCYSFNSEHSRWIDAFGHCQSHDSYLARPVTWEENIFIKAMMEINHYASRVWLGANDELKNGHWTWMELDNPFTYTDWGEDQPDNANGNEHCLVMYKTRTGHHWGDIECTRSYPFICEKPRPPCEPLVG